MHLDRGRETIPLPGTLPGDWTCELLVEPPAELPGELPIELPCGLQLWRRHSRQQRWRSDHQGQHGRGHQCADHADGDLADHGQHRPHGHAGQFQRLQAADALSLTLGEVSHDQPDGGRGECAVRQAGADATGDEPADRIAEGIDQRGQRHRDDRAVDDQSFATTIGVRGDGDLGHQGSHEARSSDPAQLGGGDVGAVLQGREQGEHHHERTRNGESASVECLC